MASLADVVQRLSEASVPLVLADTCSLLDILRAPVRMDHGAFLAAQKFWDVVTSPQPSCCLVLTETIWNYEIPQRRTNAEADLKQFCREFEETFLKLQWWCDAVGGKRPENSKPYKNELLVSLTDIFDDLLNVAIRLDLQQSCVLKASQRVLNKVPPAKRKGEYKDALIFEEFLELMQSLRAANFAGQSHQLRDWLSTFNRYCWSHPARRRLPFAPTLIV